MSQPGHTSWTQQFTPQARTPAERLFRQHSRPEPPSRIDYASYSGTTSLQCTTLVPDPRPRKGRSPQRESVTAFTDLASVGQDGSNWAGCAALVCNLAVLFRSTAFVSERARPLLCSFAVLLAAERRPITGLRHDWRNRVESVGLHASSPWQQRRLASSLGRHPDRDWASVLPSQQ